MSQAAVPVSQLVELMKDLLEENFVEVLVEGEISNYSKPHSGHCYFTLKDERGQLRCAMFRRQARLLRFVPENGLQVICRGRVSVYSQRGELQLIVEAIEPAGVGGMQFAFEQLKQKLSLEGLFSQETKQKIPDHPQTIGIVTSATGAAIHDILNILRRRSAGLNVLLRPVRVQGEGAAEEIAEAITDLNRDGSADVLIVGRGGGSLEDLWSFNEECVARAIFSSKLPVVSAVGHEIDFCIADMVADLRAPTPTAAAELVVRNTEELERHCDHLEQRLGQVMQGRIELLRVGLAAMEQRLKSPLERIGDQCQQLNNLEQRLERSIVWNQQKHTNRLQQFAERLNALSPLQVLARGYSIVRLAAEDGPLGSVQQTRIGDMISVQLCQGQLQACVTEIESEKKAKEG